MQSESTSYHQPQPQHRLPHPQQNYAPSSDNIWQPKPPGIASSMGNLHHTEFDKRSLRGSPSRNIRGPLRNSACNVSSYNATYVLSGNVTCKTEYLNSSKFLNGYDFNVIL